MMERIEHSSDREAVREAFKELRKLGWFARMNFWCCQTCANADAGQKLEAKGIAEDDMKIVFYHNQDDERAWHDGRGWHKGDRCDDLQDVLYLSHSQGQGSSFEVVGVLCKHGLDAYWSGSMNDRIEIRPKNDTPAMLRRQA